MTCEICDTATATMWVEKPDDLWGLLHGFLDRPQSILSCDDCGPQAGYKILSPLEPNSTLKR